MVKKLFTSLAIIQLLIIAQFSHAQYINWNSTPKKGFVYQISNDEAFKLLSSNQKDTVFKSLLHTLVDTFDVQKGWLIRPPKGHFILARIDKNKLYCDYTCVLPYQVFLFEEYGTFTLQVLDANGNVREDAIVKLRKKKLRIDKESKTYRIENEWFGKPNKLVTVELDGFRSVFNVEKIMIPMQNPYYNSDRGPDFYSYMITDKNKYKPGEKVRFKSYALSGDRFPLRKDLEIWLINYPKSIKIGTIKPHRPGSFASEFKLNDSLKLVLDNNYMLQLRETKGRIVSSCNFRYEDYELFGNKLDIKLSSSEQFYPNKNQLTIIATDVNGLMLKDAKATILIKTIDIQKTYQSLLVLPDTILFRQMDLDPANPTQIDIPTELFQKSNTGYQVIVKVNNSQNQLMERSLNATHFYSKYELYTHFSGDSICFDLLNNKVPMENATAELHYNGEYKSIIINLPYKEKINPALKTISLKNEFISQEITLAHLNPRIDLTGGIQKDSFNIQLVNPQKLDISWYIYQGSTLLQKGFGKEMDYKSLITDRTQTYYVQLFYLFGGEDLMDEQQFEFREDFLNVSLEIPDKVYPGQQVDATIHVNNQQGQPIKGVDLTALAVTGKLNYYLPDLPYYGPSSQSRPMSDYYNKKNLDKRSAVINLDYKKFEKPARLDTMKYYQLTYPDSNAFKYTFDIEDSTQFAPYVMQDGVAKQVYVIEVNRVPVYYSWVNLPRDYSFYIAPNVKKEISLRLYDRVLVLDSIKFEAGKKTILSLNLDSLPEKTKVYRLDSALTQTERNRHIHFVSEFKVESNNYAYLETVKEFVPLYSSKIRRNSYWANQIIGPVSEGRKVFYNGHGLQTNYNHTGAYAYEFENNIVYKLNTSNLLPDRLNNQFFNPMANINDLVLNKKRFFEEKPVSPDLWHPRIFNVGIPKFRMKVMLPYEHENSGIAGFIFEDCKTHKMTMPYCIEHYNDRTNFYSAPAGQNNAIVLYNNGNYMKLDSINLHDFTNVVIDFNQLKMNQADAYSQDLFKKYVWPSYTCYQSNLRSYPESAWYNFYPDNYQGNVRGTVFNDINEPIAGVVISIKGTTRGTVTDLDGKFSLFIDSAYSTLIINSMGFQTKEISVEPGSQVEVLMALDVEQLSEVVVVGYGIMRKSDITGAVSSISGEVTLVAPEQEKEAKKEDKIIQEAEQHLYQELLTLKSFRSNFSDVGFWEPKLFTDKHGESKFKVKFPDDITRWDAVVYAMNSRLQTGTTRKSIKSYKPLMGELHVPQFLTRGDSAQFLGKVLNYTKDSTIHGKVQWSGANTDFERSIDFTQYHIDKLPVNPVSTDSITTRYMFTRHDGYMDGEERTVPVVEQGVIRANGTLSILSNGDEKQVKASENETVNIEILDNQIDIYAQEVEYLLNYKYACNEQLASKLIGLVNHKLLMQYEGKPFKYDKDVNKIIERLLKNQNEEFLWSWWDKSNNTSYWMSNHILSALKSARDAGYAVNLDISNIARKASYKFDFLNQYSLNDLDLILSLANWGAKINYSRYIQKMDSIVKVYENWQLYNAKKYYYGYSLLNEKLRILEIKQLAKLPYQRDSILKYKKEGIMGDFYFTDSKPCHYWYNDDMASSVIAYRIARNDSVLRSLCVPMQMYFLQSRKKGAWNTWQSSNILMSVLPDLLATGYSKGNTASIHLSGKENTTVTKFPYRTQLQPKEELNIQKESGLPLFFMQYVNERVTQAKTGVEGFKIKTYFSENATKLEAGKPVNLITEIEVSKDAQFEYVMIEIPIPGACSYADKRQNDNGIETHREYFKEKTVIFCQNMDPGKYLFVVRLLPRFTGKYIVNPAQVSLMYVPVVNANTDMKQVEVFEK